VIRCVGRHPAVGAIRLVGSRAEGRATERSDWDFAVETDDFAAVALALPGLCHPLDPLAQQWDRLSDHPCYMLVLAGPVKVDLIFVSQRHEHELPWIPSRDNLDKIDAHFWDWMLWLRSKDRPGNKAFVDVELVKLHDHLLGPLGVERKPDSINEAIALYRAAREKAERRLDVKVPTTLEREVSPSIEA
jgi:nucleotidyltransferase-like protein